MRLVADQDPTKFEELIREHLKTNGFNDIEVKGSASPFPSRTALETLLNRAIVKASREAYGKEAIFEPHQAGSTPQWVIERYLDMPC